MTLLHDDVAERARQAPDHEAVTDGTRRLSYRELDVHANRLAHCLQAHGVSRGDHVLVCMKRSPGYIAAMIGSLKAGAAYVPLEARTPATRRSQIVADCTPRAVICDAATAPAMIADDQLRERGVPIVVLDPPAGVATDRVVTPDGAGEAPPPCEATAEDVACVLYTSGSTGIPKGVMITHRNVDEYVTWGVDRLGIAATDRVLGTAPFYFDMSLFDVYCSVRAGATLCVATEGVLLFPNQLLQFAEAERVTVWKGVSSLLAYLAQTGALAPGRLPTLRTVLFGGEPLPTRFLIEWMQTFPDKAFYNAYGPTEATGVSMYYRVDRRPEHAGEKIPIGIPCENVELYLLDDARRPVPPGEVGEIALGGACITRGYLNDPDKTARVFIDHPWKPGQGARLYLTGDHARQRPDGNYDFLGRKDHQIKFMGYRLELTDIENALVSIPGVNGAGVLLAEAARAGVGELVAYLEVTGDTDPAKVLAELKHRLPFYMLPKHVYGIAELPRSDRGKLDRGQLEAYHHRRGQP
jgi:L-proline---[L-prolyl-carrier protein] ligase